jgi:hypothetical protein
VTETAVFVGRQDLLAGAKAALAMVEDVLVDDTVGIYGSGKSTLLTKLRETARELPNGWPLHIAMDQYALDASFNGDLGGHASGAALRETLERAHQLLTDLADSAGGRQFGTFREARDVAKGKLNQINLHVENRQRIGWKAQVEGAGQKIQIDLSSELIKDGLRAARSDITEAFVEAWEEWSVRKKVLLTVDGFERVIGQEIGQWFLGLASRLTNTVVVLARVPSGHSLDLPADRFRSHELGNFTVDEVHNYLTQRLAPHPVDDEVAKKVHAFTGGHPGGVALACGPIGELGAGEASPDRIDELFRDLPDDPEERWARLVELITNAVEGPGLRLAVDACSVVHFFDAALLGDLIGPDLAEGGATISTLVELIERYGLAERVELPGSRGERAFRLHEFIRHSLDHELATLDPKRYDTLHQRAADHHFTVLSQIEEDEAGLSLGAWYRYEDPRWQTRKREWLYHTSRGSTHREEARLQFASVFLDAFWWWGCYLEFDFCRRLLEDWEQVATEPEDITALESLGALLDNYPTGHLKPPGEHWAAVRQALMTLRDVCGLRGAALLKTRLERHVAGLINIFLAHAYRYQDPADAKADQRYAAAAALFQRDEDRWNQTWIAFELADLYIARDPPNLDPAAENVKVAASIALALRREDQSDEEVASNIHRVQADILWRRGQVPEAFEEYGRAILHAYLFQNTPHPPDAYTKRFYQEMMERTTERLTELWHRGQHEEALAMARRVSAAVPTEAGRAPDVTGLAEELLEEKRKPELARALFPPEPLEAELSRWSSDFMDRWRDASEALDEGVYFDLLQVGGEPVDPAMPKVPPVS